MSLLDEHKAERRARILAAARRLIAARGFDGLTMRELARASRVSVPTVYNLFGGKHAVLMAELEETFATVARSLASAGGAGVVDRAFAMCEAGNRDLLAVPAYSRELVRVFLVAEETRAMRRTIHERYVALMAGVLCDGQAAGDVASWADPTAVATRMFAHYVHAMIEWAEGDLDDDGFTAATELGMALMLLGLARGRAARALAVRAEASQRALTPPKRRRARKGG
ncbi:MAG: TetR/AcrR family transcriptional regulator [Deltaproteobacteria bacterium]|nr:TetR/AcrR family transcriptional regulator [Deltaproteobacteria bacterium]